MKTYRILILTDHTNHSPENSVYAIASILAGHRRCEELFVSSRGNPANRAFFNNPLAAAPFARKIEEALAFDPDGRFFIEKNLEVSLVNFDLILMRLPRPISDDFLLKLRQASGKTVIINDPEGIIKTSNKAFLLNLPDWCPPMRLCHSVEEILAFSRQFDLVLKPLRDYGGKGIIKISGGDIDDGTTTSSIDELESRLPGLAREGFLAMKYLRNVDQGDKRIIVVDGEIMAASLRMPKSGSWLCNVAQGGRSVPASADEREENMIRAINPVLRGHGILIYGVDTLVDDNGDRVLSEINTLSIGGFPQSQAQTGRPIINLTLNKIFDYADSYR